MPYQQSARDWGSAKRAAKKNQLQIKADNLKAVTVNVKRAKLTCKAKVKATTDGPLAVKLAGCGRTLRFR